MGDLATWLRTQPGREADAEQAYGDAAADGLWIELRYLAAWLPGQPGREAEAEQTYRDAVAE